MADPAVEVPTPEEEAAKAAETARVAAEVEAARIAAEAAVKALQEAEAKTPKRYVFEYQVRDNDGNPVGNKTHLEASSAEELEEKKQESYRQAVLAIDRLKKQKPVFRDPVPVQISQEEVDEAAKNLTSEDPTIRAAAVRKIAAQATQQESAAAREAARLAEEERQSFIFAKKHVVDLGDYNNCEANNNMMAAFLAENNLKWTVENLEIALGNLEPQLAPVIRREAAVPVPDPLPANPAPVAQACCNRYGGTSSSGTSGSGTGNPRQHLLQCHPQRPQLPRLIPRQQHRRSVPELTQVSSRVRPFRGCTRSQDRSANSNGND